MHCTLLKAIQHKRQGLHPQRYKQMMIPVMSRSSTRRQGDVGRHVLRRLAATESSLTVIVWVLCRHETTSTSTDLSDSVPGFRHWSCGSAGSWERSGYPRIEKIRRSLHPEPPVWNPVFFLSSRTCTTRMPAALKAAALRLQVEDKARHLQSSP